MSQKLPSVFAPLVNRLLVAFKEPSKELERDRIGARVKEFRGDREI